MLNIFSIIFFFSEQKQIAAEGKTFISMKKKRGEHLHE